MGDKINKTAWEEFHSMYYSKQVQIKCTIAPKRDR